MDTLGSLLTQLGADPRVFAVVDHELGQIEAAVMVLALAAEGFSKHLESGSQLDREARAMALMSARVVENLRTRRQSLRGSSAHLRPN